MTNPLARWQRAGRPEVGIVRNLALIASADLMVSAAVLAYGADQALVVLSRNPRT